MQEKNVTVTASVHPRSKMASLSVEDQNICTLEMMATNITGALASVKTVSESKYLCSQIKALDAGIKAIKDCKKNKE